MQWFKNIVFFPVFIMLWNFLWRSTIIASDIKWAIFTRRYNPMYFFKWIYDYLVEENFLDAFWCALTCILAFILYFWSRGYFQEAKYHPTRDKTLRRLILLIFTVFWWVWTVSMISFVTAKWHSKVLFPGPECILSSLCKCFYYAAFAVLLAHIVLELVFFFSECRDAYLVKEHLWLKKGRKHPYWIALLTEVFFFILMLFLSFYGIYTFFVQDYCCIFSNFQKLYENVVGIGGDHKPLSTYTDASFAAIINFFWRSFLGLMLIPCFLIGFFSRFETWIPRLKVRIRIKFFDRHLDGWRSSKMPCNTLFTRIRQFLRLKVAKSLYAAFEYSVWGFILINTCIICNFSFDTPLIAHLVLSYYIFRSLSFYAIKQAAKRIVGVLTGVSLLILLIYSFYPEWWNTVVDMNFCLGLCMDLYTGCCRIFYAYNVGAHVALIVFLIVFLTVIQYFFTKLLRFTLFSKIVQMTKKIVYTMAGTCIFMLLMDVFSVGWHNIEGIEILLSICGVILIQQYRFLQKRRKVLAIQLKVYEKICKTKRINIFFKIKKKPSRVFLPRKSKIFSKKVKFTNFGLFNFSIVYSMKNKHSIFL